MSTFGSKVSTFLTAILLLPTMDPSLLARLGPWIEMVHGNAVLRGPSFHIDPALFAAIQQIVSAGMVSDPAPQATSTIPISEMLNALEWGD